MRALRPRATRQGGMTPEEGLAADLPASLGSAQLRLIRASAAQAQLKHVHSFNGRVESPSVSACTLWQPRPVLLLLIVSCSDGMPSTAFSPVQSSVHAAQRTQGSHLQALLGSKQPSQLATGPAEQGPCRRVLTAAMPASVEAQA